MEAFADSAVAFNRLMLHQMAISETNSEPSPPPKFNIGNHSDNEDDDVMIDSDTQNENIPIPVQPKLKMGLSPPGTSKLALRRAMLHQQMNSVSDQLLMVGDSA